MTVETHQTIVWVHGDNLNPNNPALRDNPDAPAIFVFDDELLTQWGIALKRITFMYECLLELPVVIRRGDIATEVTQFAKSHGAGRIVTAESPSPRFRTTCKAIAGSMPSGSRLEVLKIAPFVDYDGYIDLKRFSRYWRTVEKYALK